MSTAQLQFLLALLAHFDQWAKPDQETKLKLFDVMNEVETKLRAGGKE